MVVLLSPSLDTNALLPIFAREVSVLAEVAQTTYMYYSFPFTSNTPTRGSIIELMTKFHEESFCCYGSVEPLE